MKSISYPWVTIVCFQETITAHALTILSEMATGMEEEFHKYYNEMVGISSLLFIPVCAKC